MSKLYIVATPIGNLEDITYRAVRILREVDLILCEDTRVTRTLLTHYEIKTKVESFHTHSTDAKINFILKQFEAGKSLALVTDAGTPGISDPGSELVQAIRALGDEAGIEIVPIPGASALTAILSVASLGDGDVIFTGFVPHKKGRETFFKWLAGEERAVIFYESVHRFMKTLEKLAAVLPEKRKIVIGRELTKFHESIKVDSAVELLKYFNVHKDQIRGEFAIVVTPIS